MAGQFSKNIPNLAKKRPQLFDCFFFYMFLLHVGQSIANGETFKNNSLETKIIELMVDDRLSLFRYLDLTKAYFIN